MKSGKIHRQDKRQRIAIPRRYRLSFTNENSLHTVWTVSMSRLKAWMLALLVIAGAACIAATVIVATPLRSLLPGYLGAEQRQTHIINNMRVDSMATAIEINSAYIENLTAILTGDLDSVTPDFTSMNRTLPDTLAEATEVEKNFIRQWEERERYNLRVLTPLAAESMVFGTPVSGASIDSLYTEPSVTLSLNARRNAPMASVYSGTVVDCTYSPEDGIGITIQHPNDFISHYSGMSESFVSKGDKVRTGQNIGLINSSGSAPTRKATLEMWHKGSSINPLDYIDF